MPSRSSASSSATTTRSRVARGGALSAGVTSLEAMGASGTNRGPVTDARDLAARGACRRADPRGNRAACRGLRGHAGGDRRALGWRAGGGLGARSATTAACAACARGTPGSAPGVRGAQRGAHAGAGRGAARPRAGRADEPAWIVDAPAGRELPARAGGSPQRAARRLRLPAALPARRRGRHGVLRRRAARARRAAAGHDGHARQPDRAVRGRPPRRRGGARERVTAAGHARGGARRGGDDGRRRARDRLEPRGRGDLRLHRERGGSAARWPS